MKIRSNYFLAFMKKRIRKKQFSPRLTSGTGITNILGSASRYDEWRPNQHGATYPLASRVYLLQRPYPHWMDWRTERQRRLDHGRGTDSDP